MKNSSFVRIVASIIILLSLFDCQDNSQLQPNKLSELSDNLLVTLDQAEKIASIEIGGKIVSGSNLRVEADTSNKRNITDSKTFKDKRDGSDAFHVINFHKLDSKTSQNQQAGFVIISADKRIVPVLASSETNYFDMENIPSGVDIWVEIVLNELSRAKNLKTPKPDIEYLWKEYDAKPRNGKVSTPYPTCPQGYYTNTGILLNTAWGQGGTYNLMCPANGCDACGKARVGCGPVAIGQVWNYYGKPIQSSSNYGVGYISTTFHYPLANQRSGIYCDIASTPSNEQEMALLLREAGTAANTNYNYLWSCSALTWREDVKTAFAFAGYSNAGQRGSFINNLGSVNTELINGKPVIIDGNTSFNLSNWHIWIIDGYDSNIWYTPNPSNPYNCDINTLVKYHLNWGWGGYSNGWYVLGNFQGGGDLYNYALNVTFGMRS